MKIYLKYIAHNWRLPKPWIFTDLSIDHHSESTLVPYIPSMALRRISLPFPAPLLLPSSVSAHSRVMGQLLRCLPQPLFPSFTIWYPTAIAISLPPLLSDIWESILRAVPKKKTSHMKKRHRQMAGKALKDVIEVNTCSGCGQPKRAHLLCPTCVSGMCPKHPLIWYAVTEEHDLPEVKEQWRKSEKDVASSTL